MFGVLDMNKLVTISIVSIKIFSEYYENYNETDKIAW